MAEPKLPMRGDNVACTLLIDNQPQAMADNLKTFSIEPRHVMHQDKLMGRNRDRLDQQLRGWDAKFGFEHTDNLAYKAWLAVQAAREERRTIPEIAFALTFEMRDGTSETWVLQKCVAKPAINHGGAEEAGEVNWDVQAEEYVQSL